MTFGLALLLAASAAAAQVMGPYEPRALIPLHDLIAPEDYPLEAVQNDQQGSVRFRLTVGSGGEILNCVVLESSGFAALDERTCNLLRSRARFSPAKDKAGKPVEGRVESSVAWRIEAGIEQIYDVPKLDAVTRLWVECAQGEAARLTLTAMAATEIPNAAFAACQAVEARLKAELEAAPLPGLVPSQAARDLKDQYQVMIAKGVERVRKLLLEPPAPQSK